MNAILAQIVLEGIKTWNQERKLAFGKKYAKQLRSLEAAAGKLFPDYSDAELNLAKKDKKIFMQAYLVEMKSHNKEAGNDKKS